MAVVHIQVEALAGLRTFAAVLAFRLCTVCPGSLKGLLLIVVVLHNPLPMLETWFRLALTGKALGLALSGASLHLSNLLAIFSNHA